MAEQILQLNNVTKRFGGIVADRNISFDIKQGEIVGLVGPNGCGKTTLFNVITGFFPPTEGQILFCGQDVTGEKPHEICHKGIARTFQIVKMLPELTVLENIMVGAFARTNDVRVARCIAEETLEFVNFPSLSEKKDVKAQNLTTIDKKLLEIMRAVATKPKLLLLDEAMAGLNSSEIKEALIVIKKLHDHGITIMIIEHVMEVIMSICERVIVMVAGEKIMEGSPTEVVKDEQVIKAYLGDSYNAECD